MEMAEVLDTDVHSMSVGEGCLVLHISATYSISTSKEK